MRRPWPTGGAVVPKTNKQTILIDVFCQGYFPWCLKYQFTLFVHLFKVQTACVYLYGWSSILTTLADSRQNQHDKYLLRVYSVEIHLMMDSGPMRNMQSTLSNKFEKQCISLAFIIRINHDARSSECQKPTCHLVSEKCSGDIRYL